MEGLGGELSCFRHELPFLLNLATRSFDVLQQTAGTGAGGWELQLEGGADADLAFDVDLAGVLLHDAVADGEAKAGAFVLALLGFALGGEEGIVDAVEVLLLDAAAGVLNADDDATCAVEGGDLEGCVGGAEHRVLRVQHEVEDDLLELALVAVNAGEVWVEVGFDTDLRGLELVLEEGDGVVKELVQVEAGELGSAGAREVEQAVDDLGGAEGLLRDLFEDGGEAFVVAHVLGQHLGVAGDDGERRVDLVRDASGEQADGGELFRLGELCLELDAVGDVVDQDDAAHGDEVSGDQRGDGDVGDAHGSRWEARGGTCRECGCRARRAHC